MTYFAWGWLQAVSLLISASGVARIIDISHQHLALANFFMRLEPASVWRVLEHRVPYPTQPAEVLIPPFPVSLLKKHPPDPPLLR
jgi:hypothetical protein